MAKTQHFSQLWLNLNQILPSKLTLFFSSRHQSCDPANIRNARSAVIEALPHMLSSMALLWGVLMKEESQRRALDSAQSSRHSSASVFFKSTKVSSSDWEFTPPPVSLIHSLFLSSQSFHTAAQVLRQQILEFLLPLTGQYGVPLMASLGEVWSRRKNKRRNKNKVSSRWKANIQPSLER